MCHVTTTCVLFIIAVCCPCTCRRHVRDLSDIKLWEPYERPFRRKLTSSLFSLPITAAHRFYFNTRNKKDYLRENSSRDQLHKYWRQTHLSFGKVSSKVNSSPNNLRRYWRQRPQPFTLTKRNGVLLLYSWSSPAVMSVPLNASTLRGNNDQSQATRSRERKLKHINTMMERKNQFVPIRPKEAFGCPLRDDGSEAQTCPSDKRICLNDNNICDNQRDCPGGEDEEPAVCLLRNWIIRWMLKLQVMIYN